jgi:hypothetical protein
MSRPNRVRAMLVLAFVLTLGAGVVAGIALNQRADARVVSTTDPKPLVVRPERNWVADQIGLDPKQREQFDAIWREAPHDKLRAVSERQRATFKERDEALAKVATPEQKEERDRVRHDYDGRIRALMQERDKALDALYTPEQRSERERIKKEYEVRSAELSKEMDQLRQPMVDKSRLLLTEDQRKRFDGMMKGGDRGDHHRGGGPPGRPGSRPGTQPAQDGSHAERPAR